LRIVLFPSVSWGRGVAPAPCRPTLPPRGGATYRATPCPATFGRPAATSRLSRPTRHLARSARPATPRTSPHSPNAPGPPLQARHPPATHPTPHPLTWHATVSADLIVLVAAALAAWRVGLALSEGRGRHAGGGPKAEMSVDVDRPRVGYSPMIFGGFLEPFGDQVDGGVYDPASPLAAEDGFRTDVVAALRELKVPIVRWPGGCFVSGYDWKKGVGPTREPADDMAWGVVEPNTFGTDEYVTLCRKLGWTPFICTNAGNGTIADLQDWVA